MRCKNLVMVVIVFILFTLFTGGTFAFTNKYLKLKTYPSPSPTNLNSDKLLEIIQDWRVSNNLPKYEVKDLLCDIAKIRLTEIQTNFSHDGFSAKRFCASYCEVGENLGRTYNNENVLLNAWLNSPSHLVNLEHTYKFTCIKTSGTYAVQIFGNF